MGSTVVEVLPGDWGDVTLKLTKRYGRTFAVLNMANAYFFGGGYAHGQVAQEENMFRRTDCHFHSEGYSRDDMEYTDAMHRLVSGADGRVYLDTASPRACIKGPEERDGLGYGLLADGDVSVFRVEKRRRRHARRESEILRRCRAAETHRRPARHLHGGGRAARRAQCVRLRRVPKSEPDRRRDLQARSPQEKRTLRRRRLRHLPRGLRPGQLRRVPRHFRGRMTTRQDYAQHPKDCLLSTWPQVRFLPGGGNLPVAQR